MSTKTINSIAGGMLIDPQVWYALYMGENMEPGWILGADIRSGMQIGAKEVPIDLDKKLREIQIEPEDIINAAFGKYNNDDSKAWSYWASLYKKAVLENIVEPILRSGEYMVEYNLARKYLYVTSEDGKDVPRLRKLLLKIVLPEEHHVNLDRIVFGDLEYGKTDYERFAELLFDGKSSQYVSVSRETFIEWLRGDTILPQNAVNDLYGLAKAAEDILGLQNEVATELRDMAEQAGPDGLITQHYKTYVGRRISQMLSLLYSSKQGKSVMKYSKHSDSKNIHSKSAPSSSFVKRGKNMVFYEILDTHGDFHVEVQTIGRDEPDMSNAFVDLWNLDRMLTYAIYHQVLDLYILKGLPMEIKLMASPKEKRMRDLRRKHEIILKDAWRRGVIVSDQKEKEYLKVYTASCFFSASFSRYAYSRLIGISPDTDLLFETMLGADTAELGIHREEAMDIIKKAYSHFENYLASGQIDLQWNVDKGTTLELIHLHNLYRSKLPDSYIEYLKLIARHDIAYKQKRHAEVTRLDKEINSLIKYLETYPQDGHEKILFMHFYLATCNTPRAIDHFPVHGSFIIGAASAYNNERILAVPYARKNYIKEVEKFAKEGDKSNIIPKKFMSLSEAKAIFEYIGFPQGIRYMDPRNFQEF